MEQIIRQYADHNGLLLGICDARPLDIPDSFDLSAPFMPYARAQRINPRETMPWAKSIIVLGMGYRARETYTMDDQLRGLITAGAAGEDYHLSLRRHLSALEAIMRSLGDFQANAQVDTGPLNERGFAQRAGLGFAGRHGSLISERFGSFFHIGLLITDLLLRPTANTQQRQSSCGQCMACRKACPTGTINASESFQYTKCISYLTQKKGPLTFHEMDSIDISLYGCDICQNACPLNHDRYCGYLPSIAHIDQNRPKLSDILSLTNRAFNDRFGWTGMGWRGKNVIQRNAIIAAANQGRFHELMMPEGFENNLTDEGILMALAYARAKDRLPNT